MNTHYNNVKDNEENNIEFIKTEKEWSIYKQENEIEDDINKEKYMKYGTSINILHFILYISGWLKN